MLDPRLAHLIAVARFGSFTAAAQAIGVTQSAVTKGVADLERQLGYSLFHRTPRGAIPTELGRDFVERAERVLDDARELFEGPSAKGDPYAGVLRVGVCPASLEWRLTESLAQLLGRHGAIRFEVVASSFERMIQLLRNGAVDVAVGFDAAFREWPDIHREPLWDLQTEFFVRKGHPILKRGPVTDKDLADFDFVSPSDSRPYGAIIRRIYESQGVEWRKRLHLIDYFPTVRRIVASSDAIGVVSFSHAAAPSFLSRFDTLDLVHPFPWAPTCCAVRSRWEPKPAVRAFIRTLKADVPR